ncbi:hypothetical protein [Luteibacter yeojuensis]|nr:hypothetical protein [Luteibacter yeojuensis]
MNDEQKKGEADTTPHQYDDTASKHVEKKPRKDESPQQEHSDEDQG